MSYYRILGLEREPFSTSPDPAFFYQSKNHRSTLANLMIELRLKRGLSVVLGDVGTGKTTLGRKLIQMLKERSGFVFHMILDPTYDSETLFFSKILQTLQIALPVGEANVIDHRETLERFLFRRAVEQQQTVVLIIDEAHKMNPLSLEALRTLLNYETNEMKLLQVVLLGQIELLPILTHMQNLLDRISLKQILTPLSQEETGEMIHYRLTQAGYRSRSPLFLDDAVEEIHHATQGYPRRISMLCHQALRLLIMRRQHAIDHELISELVQKEIETGWSPIKIPQKSNS